MSDIFFGGIKLHDEENEQIANRILRALFNYLISNKDFDLSSSSLEFRITLVGLPHRHALEQKAKKKHSKKTYKLANYGKKNFGSSSLSLTENKHLLCIPNGIKGDENCMEGQCLIYAFTAAYWYNKAFEDNPNGCPKILNHLRALNNRSKPLAQKKSFLWLAESCHELIKEIPGLSMSNKGPFPLSLLETLCAKHNCQAVVFSNLFHPTKIVYLTPEQCQDSRMKLFFFENSSLGSKTSHCDVILRPDLFFGKQNFLLYCCLTFVKTAFSYHVCQAERCPACRRILLNSSAYFNFTMSSQVCRKGADWETCETCGKTCRSEECLHLHEKRLCVDTLTCSKCDQVLRAPKAKRKRKGSDFQSPIERKMSRHVCNTFNCPTCHETVEEHNQKLHACKLKPAKLSTWMPATIIYDIESIVCRKTNEHIPIYMQAMWENTLKGSFSTVVFASPHVNPHLTCAAHANYFTFDYLEPTQANLCIRDRVISKHYQPSESHVDNKHYSLFSKEVAIQNEQNLKKIMSAYHQNKYKYRFLPKKVHENVVFHFLCFFMTKHHVNSVLIAHNATRYD